MLGDILVILHTHKIYMCNVIYAINSSNNAHRKATIGNRTTNEEMQKNRKNKREQRILGMAYRYKREVQGRINHSGAPYQRKAGALFSYAKPGFSYLLR